MNPAVIICLHDVSPRHDERIRAIHAFLSELGVGAAYSMLLVPDFWASAPLGGHAGFTRWLRARSDQGIEMVLHGFYHRDTTQHASALAAWKARTYTASEGEFFGLSEEEAGRRIDDGQQVLREVIGAPAEGFVAPAWLYSDGARAALASRGFLWAENHGTVWSPRTGRTLLRGPVVSYASRDLQRIVGSHLWSRTATIILRGQPVVRFALHPHDFDVPSLRAEIERALRNFLHYRKPLLYRDLVAARSGRFSD